MPTKIRLTRHGKKHQAFFHIVVADGRAPRDGKFIEKIGTYNPRTNPATIEINFDKALHWVQAGAQPSDTMRAILSYKGVMYKDHLLRGVAKKALTEQQAEEKFAKWLSEKEGKIDAKKGTLTSKAEEFEKKRLALENEAKEKRATKVAAKATAAAEAAAAKEAPAAEAAPAIEAVAETAPAIEAATEAPAAPEATAAPETAPEAPAPTE